MKDQFFAAIKQGNVGAVQFLLSKNKSLVKEVDENGRTGLHMAAFQGNEAIVSLLLDKGAAIEARETKANATPLHMAVQGKHNAVVNLLLQRKAQVNATMQGNYTALHLAASAADDTLVEMLLQNGALASLEAKTDKQCTALHLAAQYGHVKVVERLINKKANIEAVQKTNWTPLHFAAQNGRDSVVRFLSSRANVNALADNNITPLHLSAQNGQTVCVGILLDAKANIEAVDKEARWTPLCMAVKSGQADSVNLLLHRGASTQVVTKGGNTVLHLGALHNQPTVIPALLKKNSGLKDATNSEYKTALQLAHEKGYQKIVEILEGKQNTSTFQQQVSNTSVAQVSSLASTSSRSSPTLDRNISVGYQSSSIAQAVANNTANQPGFFQQSTSQGAPRYLNSPQVQSHYANAATVAVPTDPYAGFQFLDQGELNQLNRSTSYASTSQQPAGRSHYANVFPPAPTDPYAGVNFLSQDEFAKLNQEANEYSANQVVAQSSQSGAFPQVNKKPLGEHYDDIPPASRIMPKK